MVRYEKLEQTFLPIFPENILGISHLEELNYIREDQDFLILGAGMTLKRYPCL